MKVHETKKQPEIKCIILPSKVTLTLGGELIMTTEREKLWNLNRDDVDMEETYGDVKDIRDTKDLDYNFDARDLKIEDKTDSESLKKLGRQVED